MVAAFAVEIQVVPAFVVGIQIVPASVVGIQMGGRTFLGFFFQLCLWGSRKTIGKSEEQHRET